MASELLATTSSTIHHIAEKIQTIPRYLKMSWLEGAMDHHNIKERIDTDVLLDNLSPAAAAEVAVTNPESGHPLSTVFKKWVSSSGNQTYLPSLAMAGLSCRHIERINTHDMMEVFSMYR